MTTTTTAVAPVAGSADHMSVAPGDEQQFAVTTTYVAGPGMQCPVPQVVQAPPLVTWTVSDTINVKISSAQDATNGLATCIGLTKTPVTVTAIGTPPGGGVSKTLGSATLTCK